MSDITQSTPRHLKYNSVISSSLSGTVGKTPVLQYRAKIVDDMAHTAVPFEATDFRDTLLQLPDSIPDNVHHRPSLAQNPFIRLKNATTMAEKTISERLTAAINDNHLVPGLTASLCGDRPDPVEMDEDRQKIDSALYYEGTVSNDGRPYWGDQVVPIEYKTHLSRRDPYDDKKDDLSTDADERKKVRGQIIHYAELIFAIQQRTSLFMILILGRKFRMLRWDRSGVVVSKAVDYFLNWDLFCDILWRISVLSKHAPDVVGFDPSATRIHSGDARWDYMTASSLPQEVDADERERPLGEDDLPGNELPRCQPESESGSPKITPTFKYVRRIFAESLHKSWPRYELEVPDGKAVRKFLVCRPLFRAKGMAGRGTRGYVALDSESGQLVWLKDAWRVGYEGMQKEGDILRSLNFAQVENIPTVECHGDIRDQSTMTPTYWEEKNPSDSAASTRNPSPTPDPLHTVPSTSSTVSSQTAVNPSTSENLKYRWGIDEDSDDKDFEDRCPLRRHIHYRLVVKEVGMPLSIFRDGQQLIGIIIDCVVAHLYAFQQNVLHRDISGGNIIIYPKMEYDDKGARHLRWGGLLTDWELSKRMDDIRKTRQPERTGTWQYMSVALLLNLRKAVELPDDLESFLHILLYFALRYLKSSVENVADFLEEFFDSYTVTAKGYSCGVMKNVTIRTGILEVAPGTKTPITFNSPLDHLFGNLLKSFKAYYRVKEWKESAKAEVSSEDSGSPRAKRPVPSLPSKYKSLLGDSSDEDDDDDDATEPTEDDLKKSKNAASHKFLLKLLWQANESEDWSANDKVGDRVPSNWVSSKMLGPTFMSTMQRKKAKAGTWNMESSIVDSKVGPPEIPPQSPPRARRRLSRRVGKKNTKSNAKTKAKAKAT